MQKKIVETKSENYEFIQEMLWTQIMNLKIAQNGKSRIISNRKSLLSKISGQ